MDNYLLVLTDRLNYWGRRSDYRVSAKTIVGSDQQAIVVLEKGIVNPNLLSLRPPDRVESQSEFDSIMERILTLTGESLLPDLKVFDGVKLYIYKQDQEWDEQAAIDDSNEIAAAILRPDRSNK